MAKAEKVEKVATLKERIEGSEALLLADYRGLTVVETKDLRTSLREADAAFAVVKNTLMKRAAGESGMDVLDPLLEGPTAVAFVRGDAVLAAKRLSEATRRFPTLEIKGGFMEGRLLSADDAKALAKLDSREAMLAQIAGMAKAEMSRAASMFQALQSRFLGVLEALREKIPGEPEAEPEAPAERRTARGSGGRGSRGGGVERGSGARGSSRARGWGGRSSRGGGPRRGGCDRRVGSGRADREHRRAGRSFVGRDVRRVDERERRRGDASRRRGVGGATWRRRR